MPKSANAVTTPEANIAKKKVQELTASCRPPEIPCPEVQPPAMAATPASTLAEHDQAHVLRTLDDCGGNIAAAARRLGVSRGLLYRRLRAQRRG